VYAGCACYGADPLAPLPALRSDVLRQGYGTQTVCSKRILLEFIAMMIVQR
jgi:hypothetical protein